MWKKQSIVLSHQEFSAESDDNSLTNHQLPQHTHHLAYHRRSQGYAAGSTSIRFRLRLKFDTFMSRYFKQKPACEKNESPGRPHTQTLLDQDGTKARYE